MRRRQNETAGEIVSSKDLRSACNARLGDKERSVKGPPRPNKKKRLSNTTTSSKKSGPSEAIVRLAVTQKERNSILTIEEEEIAWLREEYEFETGVKCYDWDFIEEISSLPLLISLAEKKCAPSNFLSVAGVSRLRAMVRLNVPRVKEAFDRKRVDIRYAITQLGSRDRTKDLPDIPSAPTSFDPPLVRKNGSSVLDVEYACPSSDAGSCGGVENEIICFDDGSEEEVNADQSEKIGSSQDDNDQDGSSATLMDEKEDSNAVSYDRASKETHSSDGGIGGEGKDGVKDKEKTTSVTLMDEKEDSSAVSYGTASKETQSSDGGIGDEGKDGLKDKENTTMALSFGYDSSESASMSDRQSEDEAMDDNDDDEYEVSSDNDSEDDDV